MKPLLIRLSAKTDVGLVRDHNEDNFVVASDIKNKEWIFNDQPFTPGDLGTLMMIADGMGGTNAGEVASEIAVESVKKYFDALTASEEMVESKIKFILKESIRIAHFDILEHARQNPDTHGMGTTAVLAWILGNKAYVSWSGDSRAYLFRPSIGLVQLSTDHSYVQELVDKGKITKEQAFYHPQSNVITQSLGEPTSAPQPDFMSFEITKGDRIMLCSDGLSGMIQDEMIEQIIKSEKDINDCLKTLIDEANNAGGHDNITVVMCEIIDGNEVADSGPVLKQNLTEKKTGHQGKIFLIVIVVIAILVVAAYFSGIFVGKKKAREGSSVKADSSVTTPGQKSTDSNKQQTVVTENKAVTNAISVKKPETSEVSKKDFLSKEDEVILNKIVGDILNGFNKLTIPTDSVSIKYSNNFMKNLKKMKNLKDVKIKDVCSKIENIIKLSNDLHFPNDKYAKPFSENIDRLVKFEEGKCL